MQQENCNIGPNLSRNKFGNEFKTQPDDNEIEIEMSQTSQKMINDLEASQNLIQHEFLIEGMTCVACSSAIENGLTI